MHKAWCYPVQSGPAPTLFQQETGKNLPRLRFRMWQMQTIYCWSHSYVLVLLETDPDLAIRFQRHDRRPTRHPWTFASDFFGVVPAGAHLRATQANLVACSILFALLLKWKKPSPPAFTNWIRTLCSHRRWKTINHERIYIRILLDMEALLRLCRWARCSVANWNGQHAVWQQSTFLCFSLYWIIHIVLNFIYSFIHSFISCNLYYFEQLAKAGRFVKGGG